MNARIIAFYLPQFHPIPENDEWWGKGFTEWTSVAKAKPLFRGHYQPKIPADLGFYDLRLPIVREQQAQMAKDAGIEGFCYWHYWFGNGKQLLERPFREVLESGKPDFPFCLAWANHNWSNATWVKNAAFAQNQMLMKQTYSEEDYIKHFYYVLPAFKDKRYMTVDEKPLFAVYLPFELPDAKRFIEIWQNLATENGLKGIHFVGISNNFSFKKKIDGTKRMTDTENSATYYNYILDMGFDAVNSRGVYRAAVKVKGIVNQIIHSGLSMVFKVSYLNKFKQRDINKYFYVSEDSWENIYPTILPNFDRSPRAGRSADIYVDSTPEVFKEQIQKCLELVKDKADEHKIIFLKSWNEWGEGNYVEPCLKYGHGYLDAIRDCIMD